MKSWAPFENTYRTSQTIGEQGLGRRVSPVRRCREQTGSDDWKYQAWQLMKADRIERETARAAREKEASQERLQVAVDAGQAAEHIRVIKERGFGAYEARRKTTETELG